MPPDWSVRVQYLYEEVDPSWYAQSAEGSTYWLAHLNGAVYAEPEAAFNEVPNLLKCTVTKRDETLQSHDQITIYRHDRTSGEVPDSIQKSTSLRAIVRDHTIRRLEASAAIASPNELLLLAGDDELGGAASPNILTVLGAADMFSRNTALPADHEQTAGLAAWLGLNLPQTTYDLRRGRKALIDRRVKDRRLAMTRFRVYPLAFDVVVMGVTPDYVDEDTLILHWPYRCSSIPFSNLPPWQFGWVDLPWDEPFHVSVLDEYPPDPNDPTLSNFNPDDLLRRHVLFMNPAGFVIAEEEWSFEADPNGVLVASSGFREKRFYDELGRVTAIGSQGWGSAENQMSGDPNEQGLVKFFEYADTDPNDPNTPGELIASGIRSGLMGTKYYTHRVERHPDRPDLITKEIRFNEPVEDPNAPGADASVTEYVYQLGENEQILQKVVRHPPSTRQTEAGPLLLHPVEKSSFNDKGHEEWSGFGSEDASGSSYEFFLTHRTFDPDYGHTLSVELDSDDAGAPPSFTRAYADPALATPLALLTTFEYDNLFGLKKTTLPDGAPITWSTRELPAAPRASINGSTRMSKTSGGRVCRTDLSRSIRSSMGAYSRSWRWRRPPFPVTTSLRAGFLIRTS